MSELVTYTLYLVNKQTQKRISQTTFDGDTVVYSLFNGVPPNKAERVTWQNALNQGDISRYAQLRDFSFFYKLHPPGHLALFANRH